MSENQYGFQKGKSALHVVEKRIQLISENNEKKWAALITLDAQNAFNTASWGTIVQELNKREIPQYLIKIISGYLEGRMLKIKRGITSKVTAGVPQGSVLGSMLWNILYDGILREKLPEDFWTVGSADDLAVVLAAYRADELMNKGEDGLESIVIWLRRHYLEKHQKRLNKS